MTNLQILSKSIRTFENLYSLTDLHKASGGEAKHKPILFLSNQQTKDLIAEIEQESKVGIPTLAIKTIRGGKNPSTYACEELVLAYAMWISPKFHLVVLRAFLAMHRNEPKQLALPEPEKKYIDNRNKPQYTEALSKNNKRFPHPSDLAVFLCQLNGGSIAEKYKTFGEYSAAATCYAESESRHPQSNVANLINNKELAMTNIITAHYNGTQVFFQDDAYLNATAIAAHFNKKPIDWLRLPNTEEYINTLCEKAKVGKSHFVRTARGGSDLSQRGTWLHRRLAVPFARWLNVEFAIWCDEQIEKILIEKNQPKQLALPEPEKKFTFEFTEHELQQLSWSWFALLRCTEMCRVLEPALRQIGSSYAATVRDLGREYAYSIRQSHHTLSRITEQFQADQITNWRVLRHLRNYDPKKIGFQLDIL